MPRIIWKNHSRLVKITHVLFFTRSQDQQLLKRNFFTLLVMKLENPSLVKWILTLDWDPVGFISWIEILQLWSSEEYDFMWAYLVSEMPLQLMEIQIMYSVEWFSSPHVGCSWAECVCRLLLSLWTQLNAKRQVSVILPDNSFETGIDNS